MAKPNAVTLGFAVDVAAAVASTSFGVPLMLSFLPFDLAAKASINGKRQNIIV